MLGDNTHFSDIVPKLPSVLSKAAPYEYIMLFFRRHFKMVKQQAWLVIPHELKAAISSPKPFSRIKNCLHKTSHAKTPPQNKCGTSKTKPEIDFGYIIRAL